MQYKLQKGLPRDWAGLFVLWDRVVATASPGIASQDPLERKPEALNGPILSKSLKGILRASRSKPAARHLVGGDELLIEANERDERPIQDLLNT